MQKSLRALEPANSNSMNTLVNFTFNLAIFLPPNYDALAIGAISRFPVYFASAAVSTFGRTWLH